MPNAKKPATDGKNEAVNDEDKDIEIIDNKNVNTPKSTRKMRNRKNVARSMKKEQSEEKLNESNLNSDLNRNRNGNGNDIRR